MIDFKRITTAIFALLLTVGFTGCGQTENNNKNSAIIASSSSSDSDNLDNINEEKSEDEKGKITTVVTTKASSNSSKSTTVVTTKIGEQKVVTTIAGSSSKPSNSSSNTAASSENNVANETENNSTASENSANTSSNNTPSNNSGNTASNTSSSNNSASSSGNNTSSTSSGSSAGSSSSSNETSSDDSSNADVPVVTPVYTGSIELNGSVSYTGENISVSGTKVTIAAGGDYLISGTLNEGQIEVNTVEKVKLYLNGVDITNSTGSAIMVTNAKRAVIELMDGTVNTLEDSGTIGTIFSNDTLSLKGTGALNITANNGHAISSDDDVIIQEGTYNISSKKTGITANDDITISGGTAIIQGGTNGIKSKGTVNISGGNTTIYGGTKEEKSAIYAATEFNVTGGTLFAAGNLVTTPTNLSQPFFVGAFNSAVAGGTASEITSNGSLIASLLPVNQYKCIVVSSSDVTAGSSIGLNIGGASYGEYSIADGLNAVVASAQ